jgi:hypothetical protein
VHSNKDNRSEKVNLYINRTPVQATALDCNRAALQLDKTHQQKSCELGTRQISSGIPLEVFTTIKLNAGAQSERWGIARHGIAREWA